MLEVLDLGDGGVRPGRLQPRVRCVSAPASRSASAVALQTRDERVAVAVVRRARELARDHRLVELDFADALRVLPLAARCDRGVDVAPGLRTVT